MRERLQRGGWDAAFRVSFPLHIVCPQEQRMRCGPSAGQFRQDHAILRESDCPSPSLVRLCSASTVTITWRSFHADKVSRLVNREGNSERCYSSLTLPGTGTVHEHGVQSDIGVIGSSAHEVLPRSHARSERKVGEGVPFGDTLRDVSEHRYLRGMQLPTSIQRALPASLLC